MNPAYVGLSRDAVRLHVTSFPGDGVSGAVVYLAVDDVDALYTELVAQGVEIALAPTEQMQGKPTIYVRDPDGNSLRFAAGAGSTAP